MAALREREGRGGRRGSMGTGVQLWSVGGGHACRGGGRSPLRGGACGPSPQLRKQGGGAGGGQQASRKGKQSLSTHTHTHTHSHSLHPMHS
eukprot:366498-Chlamydomonas_euryale.AAC.2